MLPPEARPLDHVPPPQIVGFPVLRADEHRLVLAYVASFDRGPVTPGVPMIVSDRDRGRIVVLEFERKVVHTFGFPNDEVQSGHPLWSSGLKQYGVFEVIRSPWVRALNVMESVHPTPFAFDSFHHYVLTFQDSMFECVATGVQVHFREGTVESALTSVWDHRESDRPA